MFNKHILIYNKNSILIYGMIKMLINLSKVIPQGSDIFMSLKHSHKLHYFLFSGWVELLTLQLSTIGFLLTYF